MITRRIVFAKDTVVPNGGQGYFPQDIRRLYNIPARWNGTGQTIGILEFSNGYNLKDAQQFWQLHGIAAPKVAFVSVDGTPNDGGRSTDDEEATLDLQWAGALAPGAQIVVYEADGGSTYAEFAKAVTKTLQYILHDTHYRPSVLSLSYGDGEISFAAADLKTWAGVVSQLDAKGVTVCISSGDQGAYGLHSLDGPIAPHADAPASLPDAIAVGGTSLQPNGQETAWTYNGPDNGGATGGGYSDVFPKPTYQESLSGSGRALPDISCNADPATGYQIVFQGQAAVVGGTSVSAPVFAAVLALANQSRAAKGLPPISGLSKQLYTAAALQPAYRDVTVGNNAFNGVSGYQAGPGWDACTGFGSFDATQLIAALSAAEATAAGPAVQGAAVQSRSWPQSAGSQLPTQPQAPADGQLPTPPPAGDREMIVRVQALITRVETDGFSDGVHHHHLLIQNIQVQKVWNGSQTDVDDTAFVAIRYGDNLGLPGPIPGLTEGQQIELQGRYIPKSRAYPSAANPGDAVLDETHHPFGYVVYQGQMYK